MTVFVPLPKSKTHGVLRRNIFLDKGLVAKVADFGMVTPAPTSADPMGTHQWMAPEVLLSCFQPSINSVLVILRFMSFRGS
jgi:serine/threonine protein kinase